MNAATRLLLPLAVLTLAACERPPVNTEQTGYRGTGMVQVVNPRLQPEPGEVPEPLPPASADGPRAGEVYSNVQVLGDLSVAEFTRLMAAMTEWVSPEEGCNYCHVPGNLASDDVYTKVVSRRMLEMTQHINAAYTEHVADTGVTCYTCHRGEPVPAEVWVAVPGTGPADGMLGYTGGQNLAEPVPGYASLPYDPYQRFYLGESPDSARIVSDTALPTGANPADIKDTEWSYALMMHVSRSLGVNCTYCHNSRSFMNWDQSQPTRVVAWHGVNMVQDLNTNYVHPLGDVLPDYRLGPLGDAPKVHCGTCHQGLPKPLGGVSMLAAYPALDVGP